MAKLFIEADLEKRTMRVFSNKSRKQEVISTENLQSISIDNNGKLKITRLLANGRKVVEIYTSKLDMEDILVYNENEIQSMKSKAKKAMDNLNN